MKIQPAVQALGLDEKGHMPEFYMLGEPFRTSLKPGMLPFQRLMQVTKTTLLLCVSGV